MQRIDFSVPDIVDADVDAVSAVLRSGWLTTGEQCLALEAELAEYTGVAHAVAVSSCTTGLAVLLAALGLPPGSRVAAPTWTFVSTINVIVQAGHRPVLLDVDPESLNLDQRCLEAALANGVDAVIGVHFAGLPLGERIHELCREHGVPLIEDGAHALGMVDHRGRAVGSGTAGASLSFYATKNLTSAEGGAVLTDNEELASFARRHRLHGLSADAWRRYRRGGGAVYDVALPGLKANMPDVLAALARSQLARFEEMQKARRRIVELYRMLLGDVDGIEFVPGTLHVGSADHLLVVKLPGGRDRQAVAIALDELGITTSVHFTPVHRFSYYRSDDFLGPAGVTAAEAVADRCLSLPLHTRLTDEQVLRVCEGLRAVL